MKRNSEFFLVTFLLVGFLLGLNIAGAAASGLDCGQDYWWGKSCGTKVLPCDGDAVFLLKELQAPRIVVSTHGTVYLDTINDSARIAAGDIRLTWYHEYYSPNSRVNETSGDNGDLIQYELQGKGLIKYLDINNNGKYELFDPVYIDLPDDPVGRGMVSRGDIRLTDVPPVDVYNEQGQLLYSAGEWKEYRWTVVSGKVDELDFKEDLLPLGSGDPGDLVRYMDADCSGDWNFGDWLYINRPGDNFSEFFVTVGDLRLYIPPQKSSSPCVLECGIKVEEGDSDAVYVLSKTGPVQLSRYRYGPGEIYLDMDNNSLVTAGDLRLTPVSGKYDPNTKVSPYDYFDLGHELDPLGQDLIKYVDLDGLKGYSLGDPLYLDLDWNGVGGGIVSGGDLRLTDVPLFDIIPEVKPPLRTGSYGISWTVVRKFPVDMDTGWKLEPLPGGNLSELLGYLDSDGDGAWSFGDKLYLQQIVGLVSHDRLVTAGDLQFCVPAFSSHAEEARPEFGDKVVRGQDISFSLYPLKALDPNGSTSGIGYVNRDAEKGFGFMDCAYLDLDGDRRVSDGDVRLTEVVCKYRTYGPNTRVTSPHDEDLDQILVPGVRDSEAPAVQGEDPTFGYLFFVDLNSNNRYDLEDPLYLDVHHSIYDKGPGPGDLRLTDVPLKDGPYGPAASAGRPWSRVRSGDPDTNFRYWRKNGQFSSPPLFLPEAVFVFDADCSRTWSPGDALYLKPPAGEEDFEFSGSGVFPPFVMPGDLRFYIPSPTVSWYDTDGSGYIERRELCFAIEHYLKAMIDKSLFLKVIAAYLQKTAV